MKTRASLIVPFLFLLSFTLGACGNQNLETQQRTDDKGMREEWTVKRLDDGTRVMHGTWMKYYTDGRKYIQQEYKDGLLDGKSTSWFEDGKVRQEEFYKAGDKEGFRTKYYENGAVYWKTAYANDKPQGRHEKWYEDGTKMEDGFFNDGERHGHWQKSCFIPAGRPTAGAE